MRQILSVVMLSILFATNAIAQTTKKFEIPKHRVVFQPMFLWHDSKITNQGTGFFAKTPKGDIVAVTSSHFLDFDGPPLLGAVWLDFKTIAAVGLFTNSLGAPGRGPKDDDKALDLRADYLIIPATDVDAKLALKFDDRKTPKKGERVWLPNKDKAAEFGFEVFEGTVVEADERYLIVVLDDELELQTQSGSPFISQSSGAVIGTLSGARTKEGKEQILLTPASAILNAIANAKGTPPLRSVVGKPTMKNQKPRKEKQSTE